jgi:hypothetical protein
VENGALEKRMAPSIVCPGNGADWVTMPGSDQITATNITITKTNPAVFYRLAHP